MRCLLLLTLFFQNGAKQSAESSAPPAQLVRDYQQWVATDPRPLVNCWNITDAYRDGGSGWGGTEQLKLIAGGKHVLPTFGVHWAHKNSVAANNENPNNIRFLRFCKKHGLPIALRSPNMPDIMRAKGKWRERAFEDSPLVWKPGRTKPSPVISTQSKPEHWQQAAREWAECAALRQIAAEYPKPPGDVLWFDNNETILHKLGHHFSGKVVDRRLQPMDGMDREKLIDTVNRRIATLYKAFHSELRSTMPRPYGNQVRFIGYERPYEFRLCGWNGENYGHGRDFDGASPGSFYFNLWDVIKDVELMSIPVGSHIDVIGQRWMKQQKPGFIWCQSVWHGPSKQHRVMHEKTTPETFKSQKRIGFGHLTPERYEGLCKYAIFVHRPRVLSHFAAHRKRIDEPVINDRDWKLFERKDKLPRYTERDFWNACVRAVDTFWDDGMRHSLDGGLVEGHPAYRLRRLFWSDVKGPLADQEKWFVLRTSADPELPDDSNAFLYGRFLWPIHAVARETDDSIYVYAYSPLGNRKNVTITVRDGLTVSGEVPQRGRFWRIDKGSSTQIIGE